MKVVTALVFLSGSLVWHCACAEKVDVQPQRWVIIATFIDRTTGKKLGQTQLGSPELEFADAVTCKAIVDRVPPVANDHVVTVMTCQKVAAVESYL